MRTFNFKAKNIGRERYLTYIMGEECELDEDALDYCEENHLKELIGIIYEEDEDYDYLTYDISDRLSLGSYVENGVNCEQTLFILRNVANTLVLLKEQAIHLSYILLNKDFIYIDPDNYELSVICLPIESKGSVAVEFKGFVRQLLANMRYDVDEDLSYVGKLLTYINSDSFNLRGLVGLTEALMEEHGISFEEAGTIEIEDGTEVVNSEPEDEKTEEPEKTGDIMSSLETGDEPLPEIGDDDTEDAEEADEEEIAAGADDELESILPAGMKPVETEEAKEAEKPEEKQEDVTEPAPEPEALKEPSEEERIAKKLAETKTKGQKETDIDLIKNRIQELVGEVPSVKPKQTEMGLKDLDEMDGLIDNKIPITKKNVVKVNRAAIIQNASAEHESEEAGSTENIKVPTIGDTAELTEKKKGKSSSILSKSIEEPAKPVNNQLNMQKAVPYLIRVNTSERIMLNKASFKIGKATRGVDYTVSGNGAVSRQHAIIIQRDGVCFIKDNKSTNHTYINGVAVEEGAEEILTHDSTITLGDEEFTFKIR